MARLWGLSLPDAADATALAEALLTPTSINRLLTSLAPAEDAALKRVQAEGGTIAAALLEHEFGTVRLPHTHPYYVHAHALVLALPEPRSAVERLFILGFLQHIQRGRMRVYTIPDDLRPLLPAVPVLDRTMHLAASPDPALVVEAQIWELEYHVLVILVLAQAGELSIVPDRGINKASMLRLAKRWGMGKEELRGITYEQHWHYVHFLRLVLQGAGLLRITADHELRPTAAVMAWLQAPRLERQQRLLEGWVKSDWDELKRFLGMELKGYIGDRDLTATHRAITTILAQVPPETWVAWETLLNEVQRVAPHFARPNGDYDNWRLVNYRGQSLDGFHHWHDVEGELLKATIGGSLRWLGLIDYGGKPSEQQEQYNEPVAFRLTAAGAALLQAAPAPAEPDYEPLVVQGTYEIIVPPHARPCDRFQVERVAKWTAGINFDEAAVYKLTKASVQVAFEQGIDVNKITRWLEMASGTELPPNVAYSLREWSGQHGQVTLRKAAVLQSDDPLLLEQIRRDRRVRLPQIEELDAQTWLLNEGDAAALATALRKAGYGLAGEVTPDGPALKERDLTVLAAAFRFYILACAEFGIEHDASDAMSQRLQRLLNERQRATADRVAFEALDALRTASGPRK